MLKKITISVFMLLYLYSVAYGIFMTELFRIPAPFIFGIPLFFLFKEDVTRFLYKREALVFLGAILVYYGFAQEDIKNAIANSLVILFCAAYFSFFVGTNFRRFNTSVLVFFGLLFFSCIVMVFNHVYEGQAIQLRGMLMGEQVQQSPSGVSLTIFTFGYQLAALVSFLPVYTIVYKKSIPVKVIAILVCLIFIYLGMNRSVLITFLVSNLLFLMCYYNYKAILVAGVAVVAGVLLYSYVLQKSTENSNNIIAKNADSDTRYSRSGLLVENLKIYADYPYGLIFHGKNWEEVIYRHHVFGSGITSHNAYLMFFTYLGPFLGLGFLFLIYHRVLEPIRRAIRNIKSEDEALLVCLCFAFIGVSMNALSHNGWLVGADGPTFFLYFSLLHFRYLKSADAKKEEVQPLVSKLVTSTI